MAEGGQRVTLSRPPTRELPEACSPTTWVSRSPPPRGCRPHAHTGPLEAQGPWPGRPLPLLRVLCAGGPGRALKGHRLLHSVPPCPHAGGFLRGSPKLRGFGSVLAPEAWSCGLSAPNTSRATHVPRLLDWGRQGHRCSSGTRLSPPAPHLALNGPWPSLSSSARPWASTQVATGQYTASW